MSSPFQAALPLTDQEWVEFLAGERRVAGLTAPPLPAPELQQAFVGSSGIAAFREAKVFSSHVLRILQLGNLRRDDVGRVLDFGCGWGRIYRVFLRHCRPGNLVGIDVDHECVRLCETAMPYGIFEVCDPLPPLRFGERTFDVVTAYSVFSHLAEEPCRDWLSEFSRVLRPGGTVFLTTLKEAHVDVWNARTEEVAHGAALSSVGFDVDKWRSDAKAGRFLFVPTGGGGPRSSAFYGESVIPGAYLEREASRLGFNLLEFSSANDLPQAFVALQKLSA